MAWSARAILFVSAVLAMAAAAVDARSRRYGMGVRWGAGKDQTFVAAARGGLTVWGPGPKVELVERAGARVRWEEWQAGNIAEFEAKRLVVGGLTTPEGAVRVLAGPMWVVWGGCAMPGVWVAWRWWRRRPGKGCCRGCGYDLRGTPERCPECGREAGVGLGRRGWAWFGVMGLALAGVTWGVAWFARREVGGAAVALSWETLAQSPPLDPKRGRLEDVPAVVRAQAGRRVAVEGYMIPLDQVDEIRVFALVPSLSKWSLPAVQKAVVVTAGGGGHVRYHPERVRVWGTLRVALEWEDGEIICVYRMDADRVEAVR